MLDLEHALALIEKEKLEKTGELDLSNHDFTELPEEVRELIWLKELSLQGINLEKLPNWIYELAIKEYFSQIQENATNLNEVKIIFLGEGASGKTSLIKRLRNENFDDKAEYWLKYVSSFGGKKVQRNSNNP